MNICEQCGGTEFEVHDGMCPPCWSQRATNLKKALYRMVMRNEALEHGQKDVHDALKGQALDEVLKYGEVGRVLCVVLAQWKDLHLQDDGTITARVCRKGYGETSDRVREREDTDLLTLLSGLVLPEAKERTS